MLSPRLVLMAFTLLTLAGTGCRTVDAAMGADDPAAAPAQDDGSDASCCVNGAFYACPNAASATRCLGEPLNLSMCMGDCTGTEGVCEAGCADKYGPDPSSCHRDAARDASCGE